MTEEITCTEKSVLRLAADLYDIERRSVSVPMSATFWKRGRVTAKQVAERDWTPSGDTDHPYAADADLTISVQTYDDVGPNTKFIIDHDDWKLKGMDSLDAYGDQAEPVLRGLLGGAYHVDHLSDRWGCVILAGEGLPELMGQDEDGLHASICHSIMVSPVDPVEHEEPKRGHRSFERDFCFRVQLTMGDHSISDKVDGSVSLQNAVDTARMLSDRRRDVEKGPMPSDDELLAEIPKKDGFDYDITAAWSLDAFKGGYWLQGTYMVRAWVVLVACSSEGFVRGVDAYTIIHVEDSGAEIDYAWDSDCRWTINRRLSRSQLHAIYPLIADEASIVCTKRKVDYL